MRCPIVAGLLSGVLCACGGGGGSSTSNLGAWSHAASMSAERSYHSATRLPSGEVLVAGGNDSGGNTLATAELYDPATDSWRTTGPMTSPRYGQGALLLPDGVLVVGGARWSTSPSPVPAATAELYSPTAGTWSSAGSMTTARWGPSLTLLPSGVVLVAGGATGAGLVGTSSAELYDPSSNSWSPTGSMAVGRAGHTATLLPSGKVLVAGGASADPSTGGTSLASAELYDPATGTFGPTGSLPGAVAFHRAVALPSGQVLATGGARISGALVRVTDASLYDPAAGTWSAVTSMRRARAEHGAALLLSGKVLVVAGGDQGSSAGGEVYDPAQGDWASTASVRDHGDSPGLVTLLDERVLVVGGLAWSGAWTCVDTADIFTE
jgi:hypothetical protein